MALKMTITHDVPLMGQQTFMAYIRVQTVTGTKSMMTGEVWYMKDIPDGEIIKIGSIDFVPDLEGENFITQAYMAIKAIPDFAAALDV